MHARTTILLGLSWSLALSTGWSFSDNCEARSTRKQASDSQKSVDPGCRDCISKAATLFATGKSPDAVQLLQSWRQRCPGNAQLRILLSTVLIRMPGHAEEAEQAAQEAADISPESLAAQLQLALSSLLAGHKIAAIRAFEKVTEISPSSFEAWSSLATLYAEEHDEAKSRQCQVKAAELEPSAHSTQLRQWRNLARSGAYSQLNQELLKRLSTQAQQPELLEELADDAAKLGAYDVAIQAADKALLAYPHSAVAAAAKAQAQLRQLKASAALETIEKGLGQDSVNVNLLALKALCQMDLGQLDQAQASCEQAQTGKSGLCLPNLAKACLGARQGRYNEAVKAFDTALQTEENVGWVHSQMAETLLWQGKIESALEEARESQHAPGSQGEGMALEARARLNLKDKAEMPQAQALLERCQNLPLAEPNRSLALSLLSLKQNQTEEAARYAQSVIERQPGNGQAYYLLFEAQRLAGPSSQQRQSLLSCLSVAPFHPQACLALGRIVCAEGDNTRAIELYRRALAGRQGAPEVCLALAKALEADGNKDESIKFYKLCLSSGLEGAERSNAAEALKRLETEQQ